MNFPADVLWGAISRSTTINVLRSNDHGPGHWARVRRNGVALGEATEGCDLVVVEFFALFHDTMRDNEFHDPEHGPRGTKLANDLGLSHLLSAEQWAAFELACIYHDAGTTSNDPTIGACWDADRLDLPRVGIWPDKRFFSTLAGKDAVDALGQ